VTRKRSWSGGVLLLASTLWSGAARADGPFDADACGVSERPWVRFEVPPPERKPSAFDEIVRHVRAELALRRIDLCPSGKGTSPIAMLALSAASADALEVSIDVRDALTDKRLSRQLALGALPVDARPLAIAVATDELLRASWLEIAMKKPAAPLPPAPPAVADAVAADLRAEPRADIGAAFAMESYAGGPTYTGGDVRAGFRPLSFLTATLRLGLRLGSSTLAPDGRVRSNAVVVGGGAKLTVTPLRSSTGVDLIARVDAVRVAFLPDANPNAVAQGSQGTAVVAGGGVAAWAMLGSSLRIGVEATAGGTLRTVRVTDVGNQVTALAGLTLGAGGSVAALF
jgi:hypothetical protein